MFTPTWLPGHGGGGGQVRRGQVKGEKGEKKRQRSE